MFNNISLIVKVAISLNMRSPNSNLEREVAKAGELMLELIGMINAKEQGYFIGKTYGVLNYLLRKMESIRSVRAGDFRYKL
jgi:hypothetical protein